MDSQGGLWTWGYNGTDSLFYSNTTTQTAPTKNVGSAQLIAATNSVAYVVAQNSLFWDGLKLHIGGTTLDSLIGVTDNTFSAGSVVVSLPQSISSGAENIIDAFVNNDSTSARIFILTDQGNLYASGDNTDGVTTGGVSGPVCGWTLQN